MSVYCSSLGSCVPLPVPPSTPAHFGQLRCGCRPVPGSLEDASVSPACPAHCAQLSSLILCPHLILSPPPHLSPLSFSPSPVFLLTPTSRHPRLDSSSMKVLFTCQASLSKHSAHGVFCLVGFYSSIVDLQYCISVRYASTWFRYICVCVYIYIFCMCLCYPFFKILSHYRLLQDAQYSSLWYTVNPCGLFIYGSVHLLIPYSQYIPPHPPLLLW